MIQKKTPQSFEKGKESTKQPHANQYLSHNIQTIILIYCQIYRKRLRSDTSVMICKVSIPLYIVTFNWLHYLRDNVPFRPKADSHFRFHKLLNKHFKLIILFYFSIGCVEPLMVVVNHHNIFQESCK